MKLSLKEKLKKWNLPRPKKKTSQRFYVEIHQQYLGLLNGLSIYHLHAHDETISFLCNKKALDTLQKHEIPLFIVDRKKKFISSFFLHKKIVWIGLFFLLSIFLLNQIFIREIDFASSNQDPNVYWSVRKYTKRIGPYLYLTKSVNEVSQELRTIYYQYAYVGVQKRGAKLWIDIEHQDVSAEEESKQPLYGEYVAKYDALITSIDLKAGVPIAEIGEVVRKGSLLATSNTQYKDALYNKDKFVPLVGEVYGEVHTYESYTIFKKEETFVYTGEEKKTYSFQFFNHFFERDEKCFPYEHKKSYERFSLFQKIKLIEWIAYEKKWVEIQRNYEEAKKISELNIYQNFEEERTNQKEKIVSIQLLNHEESEMDYTFVYLITSYRNIAEFRSFGLAEEH
ncbi:MAG: sporulation protein YqfD [Prevotella sp.]|nr:sporulation protein YqfD [Staphylococcus sp.]MCM1349705.1 sporulation protein YqfD [Prevotella sp.]